MKNKIKARKEQEIFESFLRARSVPCDHIESRSPPEPDILYSSSSGEKIAFELTELCSEEIAEALSKGQCNGDCIYVRTSDPSVRILTAKFSKKYESEYPIELLCYTNGRTVSPDELVIAEVCAFMPLDKGQFRRIWFLGEKVHLLYDRGQNDSNCS